MDEYNSGMDPEVRRYFKKISSSLSVGLLWLLGIATAGIFFHLGDISEGVRWYNLLFYGLSIVTLILLIRYLYNTWGRNQ